MSSAFSPNKPWRVLSLLILLTATSCGPRSKTPGISEPICTSALPSGPTTTTRAGFPQCTSNDPEHLCMGLTLVSYTDPNGVPVITGDEAATLVDGINAVWAPCNIAFQLEDYQAVNPVTEGLSYSPNWRAESTRIRNAFIYNVIPSLKCGLWADD